MTRYSRGGRRGATCASATSAGGSTTSWRARRWRGERRRPACEPRLARATTRRWSRRSTDRASRLLAAGADDLVVDHLRLDIDQVLAVPRKDDGPLVVGARETLHGFDRLPVRDHDEIGLRAVR